MEVPPQLRDERDDDIDVWPEAHDAVMLFFNLTTQWQRSPMTGQLMGLDYSQVRPTAEMIGRTVDQSTFQRLRMMEAEAIAASAEKR